MSSQKHPSQEVWRRKGTDVVTKGRGRVLTAVRLFPDDNDSLDLAAAAPEMARALLASGFSQEPFGWHTDTCHSLGGGECAPNCVATRAALTKAGVPLP